MVKILFLGANPSDATRLRLGEEVRQIDLKIRLSELRDEFDLKSHWAVRADDLQELLLRHAPNVVHFSGHGSAASEIIFEDDSNYGRPVSAEALSGLFAILKRDIRCVVLNSCYCEPQARAIAEHIDCVVGMAKAISDAAAISFAASFYHALGYGESIKNAFDLGCLNINLMGSGEGETPKLICPRTDPQSLFLVSDERAAGTTRQINDLTRSLIEGNAHERAIVAQILFISPRTPLAELLIERSAADPHPMVRSWLNRALGRLKTTEALKALRRNVADPDPLAALGADDALRELG
jgi:hypothetical protein